jgi:hypothetical protein
MMLDRMRRRVARCPRAAARPLLGAIALAGAISIACFTSPRPETLAVATGPRGVSGQLWFLDKTNVRIELLEVRDTAYLVMHEGRVALVPYASVAEASFETVGPLEIGRGRVPSAKTRERLRFLSRYPYGVPEAALSELLRSAGQDAPDAPPLPARRR